MAYSQNYELGFTWEGFWRYPKGTTEEFYRKVRVYDSNVRPKAVARGFTYRVNILDGLKAKLLNEIRTNSFGPWVDVDTFIEFDRALKVLTEMVVPAPPDKPKNGDGDNDGGFLDDLFPDIDDLGKDLNSAANKVLIAVLALTGAFVIYSLRK